MARSGRVPGTSLAMPAPMIGTIRMSRLSPPAEPALTASLAPMAFWTRLGVSSAVNRGSNWLNST
jgi:hypothetical protein